MFRKFLLLSSVFILFGCGKLPNDEDMLEVFEKNKKDLDRLITMFREDRGLGRVGDGFTRPSDPSIVGVSSERIALYSELCTKINAPDCIEGYDNDYYKSVGGSVRPGKEKRHIYIHTSAIGLSVSGASKGFLYSKDPQFPVIDTLNEISQSGSGTWLKQIEGYWYLYYSR